MYVGVFGFSDIIINQMMNDYILHTETRDFYKPVANLVFIFLNLYSLQRQLHVHEITDILV